jgi:hypothetical protein
VNPGILLMRLPDGILPPFLLLLLLLLLRSVLQLCLTSHVVCRYIQAVAHILRGLSQQGPPGHIRLNSFRACTLLE